MIPKDNLNDKQKDQKTAKKLTWEKPRLITVDVDETEMFAGSGPDAAVLRAS